MLTLYPAISSYNEFYLKVSDIHQLWVTEHGNPEGLPVIFLHGGPGSGCESYHPRFFNPQKYRIILLDQRGSGKSIPHASLDENTTQHLIDDLEKLRAHLAIDQWVVFGGSWGSTLGIAYAEAYPEKVLALVLRGIFLCRPDDISWFYQQGASAVFPDYWQSYVSVIPESERNNMVAAYYKRLTDKDERIQLEAAREWSIWEGRTSTLHPKESVTDHFGNEQVALSLARIECHYFMNNSFLEPNQLIKNAHKLHEIPGYIIHGRYDVVCPLKQAYDLHRAWTSANYKVCPNSGHSATEPEIVDALVHATDDIIERYS